MLMLMLKLMLMLMLKLKLKLCLDIEKTSLDQFFAKRLPVSAKIVVFFINHELIAYFDFFVDQN